MPVSNGDILQVTAFCSYNVSSIQNVFYVQCQSTVAVGDTQANTDVAGWLDDAYSEIKADQNALYQYELIGIRNLTEGSPTRYVAWPTLTTGDATAKQLPLQAAALVILPTSRLGSQVRKYIGGYTINSVGEAGVLQAAIIANLILWADAIADGFYLGDSVAKIGAWDGVGLVFSPITSYYVRDTMFTQRRRVLGVGA